MTRTQTKQFLTFDRISAILGFVVVIAGLGISIGLMQGDLNAVAKDVADARLDFVAADGVVASIHATQFQRIDKDVAEVRRNVSAQAVSIGRIEAGVEYIVNNLDGN